MKRLFLPLAAFLVVACSGNIEPGNPYDPDTPLDKLTKASMSGVVSLAGCGDVSQLEVFLVPAGLSTHPDAEGAYSFADILPTVQEIHFELAGFEKRIELRRFEPGADLQLDLRLSPLKGTVVGQVQLQDQSDHSGVTIVLSSSCRAVAVTDVAPGDQQLSALSAPSGAYVFSDVPVGDYSLGAFKTHYLGQTIESLQVGENATLQVETLVLPPVTGAVRVFGGDDFINPDYPACCDNDRFTRTRQVLLQVQGFNALLMKTAEDRDTLSQAGGWVTYQAEQTFTLSAGDGARTIYVQLEGEGRIRSEVLEGHTILDTRAPQLQSPILADGSGYTDDTGISVQVLGDDLPAESGIAEMRLRLEEAPLADDPWQDYSLHAPLILPEQDGDHRVFVQVRDRAGNLSQPVSATIRLDRLPPAPGDPALGPPVLVGNGSGYATSTDVPLSFNVTDATTPQEELLMVVCESEGCPGMAFGPYVSHTVLSFAAEGSHTLHAVFRDGAGNTYTPQPVPFVIDSQPPGPPAVMTSPSGYTNLTSVSLSIATPAMDNSGQVSGYEYQVLPVPGDWGSEPWKALDGSGIQPLNLPACTAADCPTTFRVRAIDPAGNRGDFGEVSLVLDQQAPDTPVVSVLPATQDAGPRVVNAEVVTVWVSADSSADPNFEQFLVQRNGDAELESGVGAGQTMIPVILPEDNQAYTVRVRSRDRAGNHSGQATVSFIEDSNPPSPPILYPGQAEVNADTATMWIQTPASDPYGIAGYECTINGQYACEIWDQNRQAWVIPDGPEAYAGVDTFRVGLVQEASNTIHLRGIDLAGNYSGTTFATVVENSTLLSFSSLPSPSRATDETISNVRSLSLDGMNLAALVHRGEQSRETVFINLMDERVRTYSDLATERVKVRHGRVFMEVELGRICQAGFVPGLFPDDQPNDVPFCDCVNNHAACAGLGLGELGTLLDYCSQPGVNIWPVSLLMADLSYGEPLFSWVSSPDLHFGHPLILRNWHDDDYLAPVDFDGRHLALMDGPFDPDGVFDGSLDDEACELRVLHLLDDCVPAIGTDCWKADDFSLATPPGNSCGLVAMGGQRVVWGQADDMGNWELYYKDLQLPGAEPVLFESVSGSGKDSEVHFGCRWDPYQAIPGPVCEDLFWVSSGDTGLELKALAFDQSPFPAEVLVRTGLVELRHMDAASGRIVWEDMVDGTMDVFSFEMPGDLAVCPDTGTRRDCRSLSGPLVRSRYKEIYPAAWGDLTAYWRSIGGEGYELHIHDKGSHPWLYTRPTMAAMPWVAGGKLLTAGIDYASVQVPYFSELFDPAEQSVTRLAAFSDLTVPINLRVDGDLVARGNMGFLYTGGVSLSYCDGRNVPCDSPTDLTFDSLSDVSGNLFTRIGRGDEDRLVWLQQGDAGQDALLSCNMDIQGSKPCAAVDTMDASTVHELLIVEKGIQVCDVGLGGRQAILILLGTSGAADGVAAAAYRLDLDVLEGQAAPLVIDALDLAPVPAAGILERLDPGSNRPDSWLLNASSCGDFERMAAADAGSGRLAVVLARVGCKQCSSDLPATPYPENCTLEGGFSESCCMDRPCDCHPCEVDQYEQFNQLWVFPPFGETGPDPLIVSKPSQDRFSGVTLLGDFVMYQDRIGEQHDIYLVDLGNRQAQRYSFDPSEQQWPTLGLFPKGADLVPTAFWSDSRLGPGHIFYTYLQ